MKRLIIACLVAGLATNARLQADGPSQDLESYLANLQVKLDHAAERVNQTSVAGSSVIGLRGAKQAPSSKQLYWKGIPSEMPVTPPELKQFRAAVALAREDQKEKAVASLKTFQQTYPQSALGPDARETLRRLTADVSTPPASPAHS